MIKLFNTRPGYSFPSEVDLFIKPFGGGEKLIRAEVKNSEHVRIQLNFERDSDLIDLAMVNDLLRRQDINNITLDIPYFPGARQDRVCSPGEALSVKVYADLINAMKFDEVRVFDPHSDVLGAVLDNVKLIPNHAFVKSVIQNIETSGHNLNDVVLISPDAGSNKKIYELSKYLGGAYQVVRADKTRDQTTGKITGTEVYSDNLAGKVCVIVDDICSYGGTFRALSTELIKRDPHAVFLIVSHYENVADLKEMSESGISRIYTTDSRVFNSESAYLIVFQWNQLF